MRVVFVTIESPSRKRGAPVRIYNLIKQAVIKGVTVDLITIADPNEFDAEKLKNELGINKVITVAPVRHNLYTKIMNALVYRIPPFFAEYRKSQIGSRLLEYVKEFKPDIVQIELLHAYFAVADNILEIKRTGCKIILDAHNVEYNAFVESISTFNFPKSLIGRYIAPRLLSIEKEAIKNVDHVLTCSEYDKNYFKEIIDAGKIGIIPNGVDCDNFIPGPIVRDPIIIFTGGAGYPPNEDALRFYFDEIYPLVKKKIPNVNTLLLGGEPPLWLKKIARDDLNIITPGLVPDVREYIKSARVCISPIRLGSGTSLKFLEYMGSGKPIVATSVGARGINYKNDHDALIADSGPKFAEAILRVLEDDELAARIGKNARNTACEEYDWKIICDRMIKVYNNILK